MPNGPVMDVAGYHAVRAGTAEEDCQADEVSSDRGLRCHHRHRLDIEEIAKQLIVPLLEHVREHHRRLVLIDPAPESERRMVASHRSI